MSIYSVVVIWLLAPLIELGVIAWLASERAHYKRLLEESAGKGAQKTPSGQKNLYTSYGSWPTQTQDSPLQAQTQDSPLQEQTQESRPLPLQVQTQKAQEPKGKLERVPKKANLGTIALILGMIFIVLAGVIFATTTWKIMEDGSKVLFIFASAVLFFGASGIAKKWFGIRKTSNAFYLLGSIFLFLSVVAAAYFQVLGTTFVLIGQNRWKVLWVGSLVMEAAFLVGLKGFKEKMYVQASLWGMSVSMLFLAKALQISWADFVSLMTLYAFILLLFVLKTGKKKSAASVFAHLHFWIFGAATMLWSLLSISRFASFKMLGLIALGAVAAGMRCLRQREKKTVYEVFYLISVAQFCPYASMFLGNKFLSAELISIILLAVLALWDVWKKDGLELVLMMMSGIAPLYFYLEQGTDVWWFVYTLFLALYLFRYRKDGNWRKPALSASAFLFVLAFWGQSFIDWPDWIALECNLLPAAFWIWAMGEIWGKGCGIRQMQNIGYAACLGILVWDAYSGGMIVDALLVEGCCLAVFVFNQMKKNVWWVRISGCLMLFIVLLMTKDFWMSISWWIYLLAVGIGLILFAAVIEKKKP